ncbi:cytidylyltransferase domain-containing protein [Phycisphaerales bacterium AB-hyl4]|uniref:Cytidylyltransferase domain-containing protein n=1 Tax=Natronomicrosphaera hydrolytica TaxID=3242702 RepID=A0ABV4U2V4_9BACT
MANIAIITAKGGNQSIGNKNVIPVMGVPIILYPMRAAKLAASIDAVYISTEDPLIKSLAAKEGIEVIDRPAELSGPESMHKDVILHAVREVEKRRDDVENVVVLLGNTVHVTPGLIDQSIGVVSSGEGDSCVSVWKAQDDHPLRALKVDEQGYVKSYLGIDAGSNRQAYPPAYFYDQGVWAFQKECAYAQKGPSPWVWLGEKCRTIERPWVTGRDVHSWIDISASVWYLSAIQVNDYIGYSDL